MDAHRDSSRREVVRPAMITRPKARTTPRPTVRSAASGMWRWATGCAKQRQDPPDATHHQRGPRPAAQGSGQPVIRVIAVPAQRRRRGQEPAKDGRGQLDHEQGQAQDDAQERRPVGSGRRRGGDEQNAQRVGTTVAEERASGRSVPDQEPETRARHGEAEGRGGAGDDSNAGQPKAGDRPEARREPVLAVHHVHGVAAGDRREHEHRRPPRSEWLQREPPGDQAHARGHLHGQSDPRRLWAKVVPESARERDQHPECDPPSRAGSHAAQTAGERSDREGGPRVGHRSLVQLEGARPIDEPDPRGDADQRRRPDQRDGGRDQERHAATQT